VNTAITRRLDAPTPWRDDLLLENKNAAPELLYLTDADRREFDAVVVAVDADTNRVPLDQPPSSRPAAATILSAGASRRTRLRRNLRAAMSTHFRGRRRPHLSIGGAPTQTRPGGVPDPVLKMSTDRMSIQTPKAGNATTKAGIRKITPTASER
jgi:hypothetical protein